MEFINFSLKRLGIESRDAIGGDQRKENDLLAKNHTFLGEHFPLIHSYRINKNLVFHISANFISDTKLF